jgi:hypothetical protein
VILYTNLYNPPAAVHNIHEPINPHFRGTRLLKVSSESYQGVKQFTIFLARNFCAKPHIVLLLERRNIYKPRKRKIQKAFHLDK